MSDHRMLSDTRVMMAPGVPSHLIGQEGHMYADIMGAPNIFARAPKLDFKEYLPKKKDTLKKPID